MKIGLKLLPLSLEHVPAVARKAEELGFESVWVGERLILPTTPEQGSRYPYGTYGFHKSGHGYDAIATLSYLAAVTSRIRLATGIYLLPLHNPFITARAVATLDLLSQGRLMLGVGVGWLRQEFDLAGEEWGNRLPRTGEILDILRGLWTGRPFEHHGKAYDFSPVQVIAPFQRPHPPIIFGGDSDPALARAALLGDGWLSSHVPPGQVGEKVKRLRRLRQEGGRGHLPFEITCQAVAPTLDDLRRYEDAGVDRLAVRLWPSEHWDDGQQALDRIEEFAQEVLSRLEPWDGKPPKISSLPPSASERG